MMTESLTAAGQPGMVFLVGAGPGDPGLLTRAGAEALAHADVVVYDRLASPELLALVRDDAEMVYVGKASAQHTRTQDEINTLLAELAAQGKQVCRLKGGDPLVFGRGGEEAAFLHAHGLPFTFIPGVTSAIAVPAYAGIPVTDRRCASSFAVITGHEDPTKPETALDWAGIAHGADTLVFLMGLANLPTIAAQLVAHGRPATTPAAAIQDGTTPRQRVVTGTLANIAEKVTDAGLTSPVITVVGDVVALRETLAWYDVQPLFGKRVLVTRTREQASALSRLLAAAGAEPVEFPLIRIVPLPPPAHLPTHLAHADWLVFTSPNTITALLKQLTTVNKDIRALGAAKIAAIGPGTADSLHLHGLHVDFIPSRYVAECFAAEFPDPAGRHLIIPRAEDAREVLPEMLSARGAHIEEVPVYRTEAAEGDAPDLRDIDVITFASSSAVHNFRRRYPGDVRPAIACIGPITAATIREHGLRDDIVAADYTIPGLVAALELYYREQQNHKTR